MHSNSADLLFISGKNSGIHPGRDTSASQGTTHTLIHTFRVTSPRASMYESRGNQCEAHNAPNLPNSRSILYSRNTNTDSSDVLEENMHSAKLKMLCVKCCNDIVTQTITLHFYALTSLDCSLLPEKGLIMVFHCVSISPIPDTSLVSHFIWTCVYRALVFLCGTVILEADISFHCIGVDGLEDKVDLTGLTLTIHPISD